jgi:hypothetical protein
VKGLELEKCAWSSNDSGTQTSSHSGDDITVVMGLIDTPHIEKSFMYIFLKRRSSIAQPFSSSSCMTRRFGLHLPPCRLISGLTRLPSDSAPSDFAHLPSAVKAAPPPPHCTTSLPLLPRPPLQPPVMNSSKPSNPNLDIGRRHHRSHLHHPPLCSPVTPPPLHPICQAPLI